MSDGEMPDDIEFSATMVRCLGMLSLARAIPLLEASRCVVADHVVEMMGVGPFDLVWPGHRESMMAISDTLRLFYERPRAAGDAVADYVQCRLALAAAMMIELGSGLPSVRPILCGIVQDAWAICDGVIERSLAEGDPVFQTMGTSLISLESEWQNDDWDALSRSGGDLVEVYARRLAAVRDPRGYARRTTIVHRVAELAGWGIVGFRQQ